MHGLALALDIHHGGVAADLQQAHLLVAFVDGQRLGGTAINDQQGPAAQHAGQGYGLSKGTAGGHSD